MIKSNKSVMNVHMTISHSISEMNVEDVKMNSESRNVWVVLTLFLEMGIGGIQILV